MDESLACPRCKTWMDHYARPVEGGASRVTADMCESCGGVWLDGGEVAAVYPAFSDLPERKADLQAASRPRGGIGRCPRCAGFTIEFPFFELWLDYCPTCHGLWVDGDELTDLARTRDRREGLPAPAAGIGGYRDNAASAIGAGQVKCARCGTARHVRETMMTAEGAMCAPCAEQFEAEQAQRRAIAEPVQIPMESPLPSFGDVLESFGTVIGALLILDGRCPHCGASVRSRCGH